MAGLPNKVMASLFLAVAFGGLLAWFVLPLVFRDTTPVVSDFLDMLHARSKELAPDERLSVRLPPLQAGEQVVIAMGPDATRLGRDIDLSARARSTISQDLAANGPELTFVYLVSGGEVRGRVPVSQCNLTIAGADPFVITPSSARTAVIECGPLADPSEPGQCRDIVGLWNERCAARLVRQ